MASINKSFNFRHGVQVDDKDFTVRGSLVGIGTTVPTEKLDVRGNAVVSGFTSSVYLNVSGVSTFVGHVNASTVGASGSITAAYLYGDGSNLTQLPTSQWVDVDVGLGYTSIYNNGGNVGVGTTDPRHSMQVGGDPTFGSTGVGIHSAGNVHATGVVTATKFVGELDSASLDTNPSGITVTGVATAASFSGNVVGNITGNVTGNVNATSLDSSTLSVTGVSTFGQVVTINSGIRPDVSQGAYLGSPTYPWSSATIGEVKIASGNNNGEIDTITGNLTLDSAGGTTTIDDNLSVDDILFRPSGAMRENVIITEVPEMAIRAAQTEVRANTPMGRLIASRNPKGATGAAEISGKSPMGKLLAAKALQNKRGGSRKKYRKSKRISTRKKSYRRTTKKSRRRKPARKTKKRSRRRR